MFASRTPVLRCLPSLLVLLTGTLAAQVTFQQTFGGDDDDWGRAVCRAPGGGYLVAGYTETYPASVQDVFLVRTDSGGEELWARSIGRANYDRGYSIQPTDDGGCVIAGITYTYGAGSEDAYIIRTDAVGDTVWTRLYGGPRDDEADAVVRTLDGGFAVAGLAGSFGSGGGDVWLLRLNAGGDTVWSRTYGGTSHDWGTALSPTADSGFIVAGFTWSYGAGYTDVYLIKTDARGDTQWTRTHGGTLTDVAYSVTPAAGGGYIVAGSTNSFGNGEDDVYVVKTDPAGALVWARTYGGSDFDAGRSILPTPDGGCVVAGFTRPSGGTRDLWLLRLTSNGDVLWSAAHGGAHTDAGYSLCTTSDNGYAVAGHTLSYGAGCHDAYLVKTDSLGAVAVSEPESPAATPPARPTIARAVLVVPASPVPAHGSLFDVAGRPVLLLHPGANDIRALPPGAYVSRLTAGGTLVTRRVLVLR